MHNPLKMDKTDERLIRHLVVDSRSSARQIAINMGLSTVTVLSRIKKLEKEKVILGYTARIDHEKLGYALTAIIEITAQRDKILEVEESLAGMDNICGVYDVTGNTDAFIIAKFRSRKDLGEFVKELLRMPNVENTITHLVLNTAKEDFRLT